MIRRESVPELKRIPATRIVAKPSALDAAAWPDDTIVLRIAPDELLVVAPAGQTVGSNGPSKEAQAVSLRSSGAVTAQGLDDPYAIVVPEEGFAGAWLATDQALDFLERCCDWELPRERPAFAQGAVAGIPVKLWVEKKRVLFLVPAPYATDMEERMS
jgi:hypothetical protein